MAVHYAIKEIRNLQREFIQYQTDVQENMNNIRTTITALSGKLIQSFDS